MPHQIFISEKEHKKMLKGAEKMEIQLIGNDKQKDIQNNDIIIMKANKNYIAWTGKVLFRAVNTLKVKILNNYKSQYTG